MKRLKWFVAGLLLVVPAHFASIALARDAAPPDTPAETTAPEVGTPGIGAGIDSFLVYAGAGLGAIVVVIEVVIGFIFPDTTLKRESIGIIVQGIAVVIYVIASATGFIDQLNSGADILNSLSGPLLGLLAILLGPDYARAPSQRLLVGRPQGQRWGKLDKAA